MDKLWIICVDDQREVLSSVTQDLAALSEWVDIDECESADEAMSLINERDEQGEMPALIISDHRMPGQTGVAFLAQLKNDGRFNKVKKILLTGQANHKETIDAINLANVDYYLEKPWKAEELQNICRKLLSDYLFQTGQYQAKYLSFVDSESMLAHLRQDD